MRHSIARSEAPSRRTPTTRTILLSVEEREKLEAYARRGSAEHRLVQRVQMVLLRADGVDLLDVARRLGVDRNTVWRWCDRYLETGFLGLFDLPRSGRPRRLSLASSASR